MSMHEIEHLVEDSVRELEKDPAKAGLDLRSYFWNLYNFQNAWDTGNTLFRVMDILLKEGYLYELPVSVHPDYEKAEDYFENLKEFTEILRHPGEKWDRNQNPAAGGYFQPGSPLYVEAGSDLWERLAKEGILADKDAAPPEKMDLFLIVEKIIRLALVSGHKELAASWYKVGIPLEAVSRGTEGLTENPYLQRIHKLSRENELMRIEVWGYTEGNSDLGDDSFLNWWFA